MEILELENENTKHNREELTLEKLEDGSVLVTAIKDENNWYGFKDNSLIDIAEYTLSKEQVAQVIEFLTKSLEGK